MELETVSSNIRGPAGLGGRLLNKISRTSDRDFRCFYPCEIILSDILVPALRKDKKQQQHVLRIRCMSFRDVNVKLTQPCRILAN